MYLIRSEHMGSSLNSHPFFKVPLYKSASPETPLSKLGDHFSEPQPKPGETYHRFWRSEPLNLLSG